MRELVYLSESKLQQFVSGRSRRWPGGTQVEGELKLPGFGGLKMGHTTGDGGPNTAPDLDKVLAELDSSDRPSRWFTEGDVAAGEWIHFEAPLSYGLLEPERRGHTLNPPVIFVDSSEETAEYPTGGAVRLLLHGSSQHLKRSAPLPHHRAHHYLPSLHSTFPDLWLYIQEYLAAVDEHPMREEDVAAEPRNLATEFMQVISRYQLTEYTAAWMAGYARVTAVMPSYAWRRIVIATPLYVEYIPAPSVVDDLYINETY